jgi:ubiquinone/menaquinone biosynthesis C-methylase UbiE
VTGRPAPPSHVDYDSAAADYKRTRTLAGPSLEAWRGALTPHIHQHAGMIVDIGAGTGQFAIALADWFDTEVIALEPASGMRRAGQATASHRRVHHAAGRGEAIPLATASVDVAWLSAVVHHFANFDSVVTELTRVLRAGGLIAIRGFFRDVPLAWHFEQFAGVERGVESFPSTSEVTDTLVARGTELVEQRDVTEVHDLTADWDDRLRAQRRADSLLRHLTDAEFTAGLDLLRTSFAGARRSVTVDLRLIVCRLPDREAARRP